MRRTAPIVLIGMGILLVFTTAGWLYFNNLISKPAAVPLPGQIAGLPLIDRRTGAQAAYDFFILHGEQFPLTSGAVGIYGDHQITVWAAGTPLAVMASRMIEAMREKIAQGNSPFTPVAELKDGGRTIYILEGMGQKHYYFQSENMVIWLAVDPSIADEAIRQILEAYP